jgi:Flp pilus assembly protein TadB
MSGLAIVCGAGVGLGVAVIAFGARRLPRTDNAEPDRLRRLAGGRRPVQLVAVVAVAALVALATGWLVAGLLAALAAWTLPTLFGAERRRRARLDRLEAVATWTESLRDTLSAAAGLEQAIAATAPTAPAPIRPQVTGLAQALREGAAMPDALRAFATDLSDPTGDTVVAALLLASTRAARNVAEQLGALAVATREQVAARRRVERSRARSATDARLIIATTVVMAVGLVVFNRDYLDPYNSAGGQIVLAVVGLMFAAGFRWLHRLAHQAEPDRVLAPTSTMDTAGVGR